ncbi:hypothetical protein FOZ63_010107 [Perkinsus olseni]|uniref:Uncharacterized protein n=1 Tax=Perkinsus olseni TaxID=32597 RepID=A0A7J6TBM2_PEROL|nr:hypothetical protein FOZ63_010107 [Perkinsus olseni]
MRHHPRIPCLGSALVLALVAKIPSGNWQPVLVGESDDGTRYYFEPWPRGMTTNIESVARQTVDGFDCDYIKAYREPCKGSKEYHIWMHTVDNAKGYKQFWSPAELGYRTCFNTFTPSKPGRMGKRSLPSNDPVASTANRLCTRNQLLLTENEEKPAPEGVYYGFIEDDLEAIISFHENSQVKHVKIADPNKVPYNEVIYSML